MKKNRVRRQVLSTLFVAVLSAAFTVGTTGCIHFGGHRCHGQVAGKCRGKCSDKISGNCAGKCKGKCAKPCTKADGSKKCPPGCTKPCCASAASGKVNTKCPISGEPVDPKVTSTCCGKTVAFCCQGCIEKWNKLACDEKAKKLAAAQ